jgi:hypothetical protein
MNPLKRFLLNPLKRFLPQGRHPHAIRVGLYRGIRLHLDLQCELQAYAGLYENETFADMRWLARGCHSFVDLGAAKGELSIYFLRQPGIERVVAAEPAETERTLFDANLALNSLEADPRLRIHAGFAGEGSSPEWLTLDELAGEVPQPLFIKIDIDGPEAAVLATGRHTLATKDCRLLIETHSPEAELGCDAQLTSLGYRTKIIPPAWWRIILPEHRPIPHNRWLVAWRPEFCA